MTVKTTKMAKNALKCCKRNVVFTQIEIIELPYTIGDGPANGAPVTVEWEPQDRTSFRLDFFEQYRPQRRTKANLRLSPDTRSQILLRSGHSWDEITAGANEAARLRKERTITLQQMFAIQQIRKLQVTKTNSSQNSRIPPTTNLTRKQHAANMIRARVA